MTERNSWDHVNTVNAINPSHPISHSIPGIYRYRVWTDSDLRRRHASNLRLRTESVQEHSLTNQVLNDFPVTKESSEKTSSPNPISHENDENGIEATNEQVVIGEDSRGDNNIQRNDEPVLRRGSMIR
ncbi:hypothetical protein GJ496_010991 [Pomphorhynchus laevis]|nr:hypothetical protein GJ496_010991 [Pomphorhynchus laevis]